MFGVPTDKGLFETLCVSIREGGRGRERERGALGSFNTLGSILTIPARQRFRYMFKLLTISPAVTPPKNLGGMGAKTSLQHEFVEITQVCNISRTRSLSFDLWKQRFENLEIVLAAFGLLPFIVKRQADAAMVFVMFAAMFLASFR